jgi:hypothetical protein
MKKPCPSSVGPVRCVKHSRHRGKCVGLEPCDEGRTLLRVEWWFSKVKKIKLD